MADLFTQALLGGEALDPSTVDLGVVITDRSLLAPAHADAALIEGLGAVPYEHIRDAMYEAVCASPDADSALRLRRLYTDPEDGQLVAMDSRARADRSSRATRNKRAPPLDPLPDFHQLPTVHDALLRLHRAILGDGLPGAGDLSPACLLYTSDAADDIALV